MRHCKVPVLHDRADPGNESAVTRRFIPRNVSLFLSAGFFLLAATCSFGQPTPAGNPKPASVNSVQPPPAAELPVSGTRTAHGDSAVAATPGDCIYTVIYFHRTLRCATCLRMEEVSRLAVQRRFAEPISRGVLQWQTLNLDLSENRGYEQEYHLEGSSLVFTERSGARDIRWERADGIWEHVGNSDKLTEYVCERLRSFMRLPEDGSRPAQSDPAGSNASGTPQAPRTDEE